MHHVAVGDDVFLAFPLHPGRIRYGLPRKLDLNLSANQNAKIAANERQKYTPVHKKAFPAFVTALSLASKKDCVKGRWPTIVGLMLR